MKGFLQFPSCMCMMHVVSMCRCSAKEKWASGLRLCKVVPLTLNLHFSRLTRRGRAVRPGVPRPCPDRATAAHTTLHATSERVERRRTARPTPSVNRTRARHAAVRRTRPLATRYRRRLLGTLDISLCCRQEYAIRKKSRIRLFAAAKRANYSRREAFDGERTREGPNS